MHEKSEHIENEKRIASKFAALWGMETSAAPPFCPVDGCFFKGNKPFAFYEIKKRGFKLANLDNVFIDKKKLDRSFCGALDAGVSLVLLFEFLDGLFYCPIKEKPNFSTKTAGPAKKRDKWDEDEVYLIPRSSWKKGAHISATP